MKQKQTPIFHNFTEASEIIEQPLGSRSTKGTAFRTRFKTGQPLPSRSTHINLLVTYPIIYFVSADNSLYDRV